MTGRPAAPMPMSATDSPNATMISAPCRSTKCAGWIENRPCGWMISGDSACTASAAIHSAYPVAPRVTPAAITSSAEATLNGTTRRMFRFSRR